MACGHPVVGAGGVGKGCCQTTNAIQYWVINRDSGSFRNSGCFVVKNIVGSRTLSVHATGRAGDIGIVPSVRSTTYAQRQDQLIYIIDKFLLPAACKLGIQRMIFKGKTWVSTEPDTRKWADWRTFTGAQNHNDHLHFEISPGFCNRFSLADVSEVMRSVTQPVAVPPAPITPTAPPSSGSGTGSIISTGTNTGSGNTNITTGGDVNVVPTGVTDTSPVWSPTQTSNTPCTLCGPPWSALTISQNNDEGAVVNGLLYTHCGGTGGTCIEMGTGRTCSVGSAPQLGDFPGGIRDFIYWGDGAYGLSADGTQIWNLGNTVPAVFTLSPGVSPPWEQLFVVNPTTIGVSASSGRLGFRSARAKVNSIATHTCC